MDMSSIPRLHLDDVYVVVAAYCEPGVITETVSTLVDCFPHVVVVDDGSPDATAKRASRAGAVVLRHPFNLGQGAALQTGIAYALKQGARYVATFDADGQHAISDLKRMLEVLKEDNLDIVLGSRFLGEAHDLPRLRWIGLKAAVLFTKLTSGLRLTDTHNGLRAMTADAARKLTMRQNRMAHASEIINGIARFRLRYREVPVTIRYSEYSLSKGQKLTGSVNILVELFVGWLRR
jgi:glycosyltransferase involved in cell wall biosynthesis